MTIQSLRNALGSIGFSEQDVDRQINEVGTIIITSILQQLAMKQPSPTAFPNLQSPQDAQNFLANFSKDEVSSVIQGEASRLAKDYITQLTSGLSEVERQHFFAQLAA